MTIPDLCPNCSKPVQMTQEQRADAGWVQKHRIRWVYQCIVCGTETVLYDQKLVTSD